MYRLFHLVFLVWILCGLLHFGFCCDSLSIWYVSYVRTLISPFFYSCLRYTICFSYFVYYVLFYCFLPEVTVRFRDIRACPVTTD